jgi:5'-nucleotidase
MQTRPYILVTNDDGVHAPGIRHLWQSISEIADVVVVAPAAEQSATGLSITIREPLKIEKVRWTDTDAKVWSVSGTPADCVKMALRVILTTPPDLIISGINRGSNAGRNVLYSGTVAAVIEGTLQNIPGMALSIADFTHPPYQEVERHVPSLLQYLLKHPLPPGTFMNVNFPLKMDQTMHGIRFTKQGKEYWMENPEERRHPDEEQTYYWLGAKLAQSPEEEDSDIIWLRKGYAAAVPIYINDLTHHSYVEKHREKFDDFIQNASSSVL